METPRPTASRTGRPRLRHDSASSPFPLFGRLGRIAHRLAEAIAARGRPNGFPPLEHPRTPFGRPRLVPIRVAVEAASVGHRPPPVIAARR